MRNRLGVALLGLLATACVAPYNVYGSMAGAPVAESYAWATAPTVKNLIVQQLAQAGYVVRGANEYSLTVERPAPSALNRAFASEAYPQAMIRATFTIVPGDTVKVSGIVGIVTNPGSGAEQVNDATGKWREHVSAFLFCVKMLTAKVKPAPACTLPDPWTEASSSSTDGS